MQPGEYFDGDAISDSLDTTAQAVSLVNAPFKHVTQFRNASSNRSFSFARDFASVEAAYMFKLESEEHAVEHATGDLTVKVGETVKTYNAALTRLDSAIRLTPSSVRLVLSYDFVTGAKKDDNSQS